MTFATYAYQVEQGYRSFLNSDRQDETALQHALETTWLAVKEPPLIIQARLTPLLERRWESLRYTYEAATNNPDIEWENEWRREWLQLVDEWLTLLRAM